MALLGPARDAAVALAVAWALTGPAAAQTKPPASNAPEAAPGGKFAPPAPPPAATAPARPGGKFADTPPARPPAPQATIPTPTLPVPTFPVPALPPAAATGPKATPDQPRVAQPPAAPSPAAPFPAAPAPLTPAPAAAIPADEPAMLGRFRAMLGAETTLTYAAQETIDPLRGSVRLREATLRRPDRTAIFNELTLDGLRDDGIDEGVGRGITLRDNDSPPVTIALVRLAGIRARAPAPGERFMPEMLTADTIRIESLRAEGPSPVTINEITVEDFGTGRNGRVLVSGLDVRVPDQGAVDRVRVGRITVRNLDLATVMQALIMQSMPTTQFATGSYDMEIDTVSLHQGDRPLGGFGSMRAAQEVTPGRPEVGRFALRDIRVEALPGLDAWLTRFGYSALAGDLTGESRQDRATGRLEVTSLALGVRDAGTLAIAFTLDGATPEAMAAQAMDQMRLVSATMRYRDAGLLARVLRDQARTAGVSEAQLRQQLAAQAGGVAAMGRPADAAALQPIADAAQRFIRGQASEIEIALRPAQPIAFDAFAVAGAGGPAAAQRAFGLSATAR